LYDVGSYLLPLEQSIKITINGKYDIEIKLSK